MNLPIFSVSYCLPPQNKPIFMILNTVFRLLVHAVIFSRARNAIFCCCVASTRKKCSACVSCLHHWLQLCLATQKTIAENQKVLTFLSNTFQGCMSKTSENWKLQRTSHMFTRKAKILFKLAKTSQNRISRNIIN